MLLAGAGLMTRSFLKLQNVNPGFEANRVLTMQVQLPASRYKEDPQIADFSNQLLDRMTTLPGVEAAALVSDVPFGGSDLSFGIEGKPTNPDDPIQDAEVHTVSPDYFKTMGIQLKRGDLFTTQDNLKSPGVVVVSEKLAARYFGDQDPIGRRITLNGGQNPTWLKIIGIVSNINHEALNTEPYPQMYAPIAQQTTRNFFVVLRGATETAKIAPLARAQIKELDASVPLFNIRTMNQILADSIAVPRFNALLIVVFSLLALILASVGIYGVISYGVSQRRHEIGIRMALGAKPFDIQQMVVGQGFKLALAGIAIGLLGLFLLTRLLSNLLFEVSATDSLTFISVSLILTTVALAACFVPARRAAKTDPMVALRYE
jgi:putative ABC transport system permease protein